MGPRPPRDVDSWGRVQAGRAGRGWEEAPGSRLRSLERALSCRGGCEGLRAASCTAELLHQGPTRLGTVQAQDTALPCRGRRPAPGRADGGGLRDDAGSWASCLSPFMSCDMTPAFIMVLMRRGMPACSVHGTAGGPRPRRGNQGHKGEVRRQSQDLTSCPARAAALPRPAAFRRGDVHTTLAVRSSPCDF